MKNPKRPCGGRKRSISKKIGVNLCCMEKEVMRERYFQVAPSFMFRGCEIEILGVPLKGERRFRGFGYRIIAKYASIVNMRYREHKSSVIEPGGTCFNISGVKMFAKMDVGMLIRPKYRKHYHLKGKN